LLNSTRPFNEEQITALLKLFHEIEREETLPNIFMKPILHSSLARQGCKKKKKTTENYKPISSMSLSLHAKIFNKILETEFNSISKR
jgi:hypothetical protein